MATNNPFTGSVEQVSGLAKEPTPEEGIRFEKEQVVITTGLVVGTIILIAYATGSLQAISRKLQGVPVLGPFFEWLGNRPSLRSRRSKKYRIYDASLRKYVSLSDSVWIMLNQVRMIIINGIPVKLRNFSQTKRLFMIDAYGVPKLYLGMRLADGSFTAYSDDGVEYRLEMPNGSITYQSAIGA